MLNFVQYITEAKQFNTTEQVVVKYSDKSELGKAAKEKQTSDESDKEKAIAADATKDHELDDEDDKEDED